MRWQVREAAGMGTRTNVGTALWLIGMGVVLFTAGGDWRWPQVWVFLAESGASAVAVGIWLARHDPALLEARTTRPFHPDQSRWDRLFLVGAGAAFVGWLVWIGVDARRFEWSSTPVWTQALGATLIALCMLIVWQVFRHNSFAAPQVRIQADRGQHVVTSGPYRIVRHPMYAAAILYFAGVPLLLGSCWGLVPAPFFIVGLGARAVGEERVLRQALPGYDDYIKRVRFRLVPGLW
jgi:protein-S-isoprenylcysteine O-methyltransferase Ste14